MFFSREQGIVAMRGSTPESMSPQAQRSALEVLSDEALMARIADGDEHAYQALVDRHLGQSLGMAAKVLGNRAEGEEIAQEAFLRLWRHAPNWSPKGAKFTTWFYRVVMNLCIDRQRTRRATMVPLDAAGDPADDRQGADDQVQQAQIGGQVAGAVADLPERQRIAITLCYLHGMSNKEAADVLDINIKALESLLTRGRRALKDRLSHMKDELMGFEQ